jgi:hypothetical protein
VTDLHGYEPQARLERAEKVKDWSENLRRDRRLVDRLTTGIGASLVAFGIVLAAAIWLRSLDGTVLSAMLMVFAALLLVALLTRAIALRWYSYRAERAARRVDGMLRELDEMEALASTAKQAAQDADEVLRTARQNSDDLLARSREVTSDLLHWALSDSEAPDDGQSLDEEPVAPSDLVQRTAAELLLALDRAREDAASYLRHTRRVAARELASVDRQESWRLAREQGEPSMENARRIADTLRERTREEVRTFLAAAQLSAEENLERVYEEAVARLEAANESSNLSGSTPGESEGDGE